MRNPLLVAIELSKVRLQCHYPDEQEIEPQKQEVDGSYSFVSTGSSSEKATSE